MAAPHTEEVNPQENSSLLNRIPGEVRNKIFELVCIAYYDKSRPTPQNTYHYRPGFRYAHRIDTALLRTCRRVYTEAHHLPTSLNSHVEWHERNRGPSQYTALKAHHPAMTSVQLFMQQVWLESWDYTIARRLSEEYPHLRELKITIRHSDWWWWERWAPLHLDPKCHGRDNTPPSASTAWGRSVCRFANLERLVFELETRVGKKNELDAIVAKAGDWRFPHSYGHNLVLNPAKTKRTGWIGRTLRMFAVQI